MGCFFSEYTVYELWLKSYLILYYSKVPKPAGSYESSLRAYAHLQDEEVSARAVSDGACGARRVVELLRDGVDEHAAESREPLPRSFLLPLFLAFPFPPLPQTSDPR